MTLLSSVQQMSISEPIGSFAFGMEINVSGYCDSMFARNGICPPDWLHRASKERKAEFLCGRILARYALSSLGYGNIQVNVDINRCPLWPTGVSGSISHTKGYAICVIGKCGAVRSLGIDIEAPFELSTYQSIWQIFVTPEESEYVVNSFPQEELGWIGATIYSSKESIFKCLYPGYGQYFDFHEAVLVEITPDLCHHQYRLSPKIEPANNNKHTIDVRVSTFRGLIVTVCST